MTLISVLTLTLVGIIGGGIGVVLLLSMVHGVRGKGLYCKGECHYHPECSYHYLIRVKEIITMVVVKFYQLTKITLLGQDRR